MARVAALRYGSSDYYWINDMHPNMVMHPIKPEMNGNDLSAYKDPNGKTKAWIEGFSSTHSTMAFAGGAT